MSQTRCGCPCASWPCPCPCPCPDYDDDRLFTVTFDANGGMPTPPPQTVPYGGYVTRPTDPVRVGHTFAGWYAASGLSAAAWDFDTDTVTGDMTLIAQWTLDYYTVAFDTNGGAPTPASQTVAYGGHVTRPTDPIRPDYVFVAWYPTPALIGNPWVFGSDVVTGNMTLYARWLEPA